MELNSIAFNDVYEQAICSSLYEIFYVVKEDIILPEYLALVVKTDWFRKYCDFLSNGSAREYCRVANISDMEIKIPEIKIQKKIVENSSQIKERIEYLNNANLKLQNIIDSVFNEMLSKYIEKEVSISYLGEFVRGKNITADEMVEGNIEVISAGINPSGMHNESNVHGISITISSSGANAGYVSIHYNDIWAADCSYCNNSKDIFYLYECLRKVKDKIDILKDGHTGQPHVYAKDVNAIKIPLLDEKSMFKFRGFSMLIFNKIKKNNKELKLLLKMYRLIIESLQ